MPILEPEVDIHCPDKAEAEKHLKAGILEHLGSLEADQQVMLKLTLPDEDDFYADCIAHARILKVVALSGGYTRDDANTRLARNRGMVASFSRALLERLTAGQSDAEFNEALDASIESIYQGRPAPRERLGKACHGQHIERLAPAALVVRASRN